MRRIPLLAATAMLVTTLGVASSPPAAALTLPAGFQLLSYPTGQAEYNLTNFEWLPGGALLTSGKDGTITYVPAGGTPQVVTQVPGVRVAGDHGFLGFALANDYLSTGTVYVTYDKGPAAGSGFGMVEEWTAAPPEAPTSFTFARTIIDGATTSPPLIEEGTTHSIDSVMVAADDSLFVSIGDDAKNNGDPLTLRAQDLDQPYGKLLHLTADGLGVAANPFYVAAAPASWRSMVYAYGLRNPFRFDFDPRSSVIQLGDVGWRDVEEIDSLTPGANAGWPCYEGNQITTFSTYPVCQELYAAGSALPPIVTYAHNGSSAAVIGGVHYTGTSYPPAYDDAFFYGDYTRHKIWTLTTDLTGALTRAPEVDGFAAGAGGPVAFQTGPNGDITYADLVNGTVKRIVYSAGNRAPVAAFTTETDAETRTVTFSSADSYDLDGDEFTASWDFGDGTGASGANVMHTYSNNSPETVTLTVQDQLGATGSVTHTVYPGNYTPVIALDAPVDRTYAVGDSVELSATASDEEDGPLPITWTTALLHCPFAGSCHVHPEGSTGGPTYSELFTDHGSDTTMVITASATDEHGAVASETYEAVPTLHTVAVDSPAPVSINGELVTSAQAVEASSVEVTAPLSWQYWRFVRWSDGGPPTHSFTMPRTDVGLVARYETMIQRRYAAMGGRWSFLRAPTGLEYDVPGGRARNYLGGRMYWTAAGGPHWSRTAVLTAYLAAGGPAGYGLPIIDVRVVTGGQYQHYTGGRSIFSSRVGGTRLIFGPIQAKYAALGYQNSCLGFPTSGVTTTATGQRATFAHGTIAYSSTTKQATARCNS